MDSEKSTEAAAPSQPQDAGASLKGARDREVPPLDERVKG